MRVAKWSLQRRPETLKWVAAPRPYRRGVLSIIGDKLKGAKRTLAHLMAPLARNCRDERVAFSLHRYDISVAGAGNKRQAPI